jgi:hypothetical protein
VNGKDAGDSWIVLMENHASIKDDYDVASNEVGIRWLVSVVGNRCK